jgi:hypothetical protein
MDNPIKGLSSNFGVRHLPIHTRVIAMSETGEECEISGLYFGSGGCGHATERRITKDQQFPECRICGKAVNWTLLRKMEAEREDF